MFKQLVEWLTSFIFLAKETSENTRAIRELRVELNNLATSLERLAAEVRLISEREKNEREKLILQIENALLKLERRLPEPKSRERKG
jgi:hypothetical protein